MVERLRESEARFERVTMELGQPEIISDRKKFSELSKEHAQLQPLVDAYREFSKNYESYKGSLELLDTEKDAEILSMAKSEVSELEPIVEKQIDELQLMLLPKDSRDEKNAVLEVRAGVGGDEAGLFCAELYRAYVRYAETQGWKVEPLEIAENSAGGFKEVSASIIGDGVFAKLKHESGVHRVQRVPKTEAQGRVHTSTVTVAILPEVEDIEFEINPNDLKIDTYRAGGAGGQHVNKTDSAVRITHLPTGEIVACQAERSQHKNKDKAMKLLRSRIYEKMREDQMSKAASDRRAQVGGGFRNERIRTYNFPQGRVSDHRITMTTYNINEVMAGHFDEFISALNHHYQTLLLKGEDLSTVKVNDED
ncbi:MAG: peptide chain release factor 1 [Bdellovibrionota bacterium]